METITLETIHKDLEFLKKEIIDIKERMVDVDVILTEEERRLLDESVIHEKEGKLISLEELENARNKIR